MATINDYYSPYAVVPKLPTYRKPYNPQTNTDPSAYYTKALGFLPIDTRYMVNPTNSLTYNSMADVLFNKAAQDKRWADTPIMQGVLNPLRMIADTILLTKDTVVDPMIQGAIDDGFKGFMRGGSTALMNSLVNLGNTLDIVSNPIKGLVLDGGEGFVKGLIGDENGRKQYDYTNYIDTGNGAADFLLSLAAEIVSDPLNLISLGTKALVSSGTDAAATTVTKSIKEAMSEVVEAALENGYKNVDEFITASKAGLIEFPESLAWIKNETKESLFKEVFADGTISKTALSNFDDSTTMLSKGIRRAEKLEDYNKAAKDLTGSKASRYKASYFNPNSPKNSPAFQMLTADYLRANAANTLPDVLRPVNNSIKYGTMLKKGVDTVEKGLRHTAGATGLDETILLTKAGARTAAWIRNTQALKDPAIIRTIGDLTKALNIDKVDKVIEDLSDVADVNISKELISKAYSLKNTFNYILNQSSFDKKSIKNIQSIQSKLIEKADGLAKSLKLKDVDTFEKYIKYLEAKLVALQGTDGFKEASEFIEELQTINKILTEDFTDDNIVKHYKRSVEALQFKNNQEVHTQQQQMNKFNKDLAKWYKEHSDIIPELEKHGADVSDALKKLTTVDSKTGRDILDDLRERIIPYVQNTLGNVSRPVGDGLLTASFKEVADAFNKHLDEYLETPDDILARSNLVKSYQDLAELLKSETTFKIPEDGMNTSNVSEILNDLTAKRLERPESWGTVSQPLTETDQYILNAAEDTINNLEVDDLKTFIGMEPIIIRDTSGKFKTISGSVNYNTLKKFYNFFKNKDVLTKLEAEQFSRIKTAIQSLLEDNYGGIQIIELLEKANNLKSLIGQGLTNVSDTQSLLITKAINDLPDLSVKPLTAIIDPADVSKYKLVVYTVMNRITSFAHRMLGLSEDGTPVTRVLEKIIVSPKLSEDSLTNESVGDFLNYIKDRLPKHYDSTADTFNTDQIDFFVNSIRDAADDFLNHTSTSLGEWFGPYFRADIDSLAEQYPALKQVWDDYNAVISDVSSKNKEASDLLLIELKEATEKFRTVFAEHIKTYPAVRNYKAAYTTFLETQAENILKMSDEDIIALAQFKTKEIYNYPEAHLANLINEYEDTDSMLYKFLNGTMFASDSSEGAVITATKNLIERLQSYKGLINEISLLAKANGLKGFYTEGLLDSFMTQLIKHPELKDFHIPKMVNEWMSSTNLFVRNIYDAPYTSMDRLLNETVRVLENNQTLDADMLLRLNHIRTRLESGLAHGAVTDVDNLIDLMWLSKHSDDVRIKDMFESFRTHAVGKKVIVFDIESTGATETAAQIFQIAGKVLDENGEEIVGSNFNFIIKPPAGYKPTPTVLKTIAPDNVDPVKWWNDEIVNAKNVVGKQLVFDNIEDALEAFTKRCVEQGPAILMGHNIKAYDLPALIKRATQGKQYLKKAMNDAFDTLKDIEHRLMFQLTDAQENAFKKQLEAVLKKALVENNPALGRRPFDYGDINTLSELKQLLKDSVDSSLTEADIKKITAQTHVNGVNNNIGTSVLSGNYADELENIIDKVLHEWRSPSRFTNNASNYFIVSKLNPHSVEKQIQEYLTELANKGLINVAPGTDIMKYMSGGVSKGNILINPVRVISYEVEDIFDLKKITENYAVKNIEPGKTIKSYKTIINKETKKIDSVPEYYQHSDVLRMQDLAKFTKQARDIQRIRNWLPRYYIDTVVDDARTFLKEIVSEQDFVKLLYDDADNITIVAAAIYAYKRCTKSFVEDTSNAIYKQFDIKNVIDKINDLYKKSSSNLGDEHYTPILYSLDENGIPHALFEENWQTLEEFVDTIQKDMKLDGIKEYNVGHNLYNLHTAAKHALLSPIASLAKKVDKHLDSLGTNRIAAERSLKQYHATLDTLAVKEILNRTNRTDMLAKEMYVRGGYTIFETASKVDLSDFKVDARFVVVDNILNINGKYIQVIAATRETFNTAVDMIIPTRIVKGVHGIDETLIEYVEETRNYLADRVIKNLGYSHGDVFVTDTVDSIQEMLERVGVPKDVLNKLVSKEDLLTPLKHTDGKIKRAAFANTARANNSIIGGKALWEYITNDSEVFCITDPFKQAVHTIKYSNAERTNLIHYCSLLLNDYTDVSSNMFKMPDKDLYTLLKKDKDMCMVYITKSGYWDHTKSGLIVKEFDLVNVNSIKRARQMGGVHIIPRTQAAQLMKAVNEFELPPIAKIAKSISDVYKVGYLGSLGFIIRNIVDSNYKTYASLDGQVSLGKSVSHFVQTLGMVRKYTSIGQEYSSVMKRYFTSDLEYEVFYKYCNGVKDIVNTYPEKLQSRVTKQIKELSEKFDNDLILTVKPQLIAPELFSIVDAFINHGPSAGLSKTILNNIPSASKNLDDVGVLDKVNKWITQDTPARFVYGANDYIEQAARLSMFLQRLELGDTIDEANKAIIKAHFDYSDKSIGMLYTEIVFPFMSFSYKNLNFWIDMMYSNPILIAQMENIFRPILDYQGLFEPDQGAYQAYDYTFDWSKDVTSFEANAPWTMINAARLYHILNGNILIKHGNTVMHDAGYGEKENELYTVFKLSPSVLDATKMLFTPLNTYSERLLPPYETMVNIFKGMANGENVVEQMNIASLANMLPYFDTVMQRLGIDEKGLRHNNVWKRIEDTGIHQALPSIFGAAYIPIKDNHYWYDSDYNILGGLKTNYYAKRNYSNPYNSKYPSYTLTRMAQNKKPRSIYDTSKTTKIYNQQYNSIIRTISYRSLEYRLKDYNHYYN